MSRKSFTLKQWIPQSFVEFIRIYRRLFWILLALCVLGWSKWLVWETSESKTLVFVTYLFAYYLFGCLFRRIISFTQQSDVDTKDLYLGPKQFMLYFLTELTLSLIFFIGLVFFIVPGFYLSLVFSMARLIILDRKTSIILALQESYQLTKGHLLSLSAIVLPALTMAAIGRFTLQGLSGEHIGNTRLLLITVSSVLLIINYFLILPFVCVALTKAYRIFSYDNG
jgi:hypothetical protein